MNKNSRFFGKILQFAILGMAQQLRDMQQNLLILERFPADAVLFPESMNPLRQHKTAETLQQDIAELTALLKSVQQGYDTLNEAEMEQFAKQFKSKI